MENSIKIVLKQCLYEKDLSKYNELLKEEIIRIYTKKVQEKKFFFEYSSLVELLEYVEKFLDEKDLIIFRYFYDFCKKDYEPGIFAKHLTEVYEKIIV